MSRVRRLGTLATQGLRPSHRSEYAFAGDPRQRQRDVFESRRSESGLLDGAADISPELAAAEQYAPDWLNAALPFCDGSIRAQHVFGEVQRTAGSQHAPCLT